MVRVQNFNASSFERNISSVGEKFGERKERGVFEDISEREQIKRSLKELAPQVSPQVPVSVSQPNNDGGAPLPQEDKPGFLPNYIGSEREDSVRAALDSLVTTALHGNLSKALDDAKKLPPFLEDAFHDALTDKILPIMKERGLL